MGNELQALGVWPSNRFCFQRNWIDRRGQTPSLALTGYRFSSGPRSQQFNCRVNAEKVPSAREATSWGAGLNWYLNRNVKLMLDYERTHFKGGNSSPLTAKGENVFFTRIQLAS